MEKLFLKYNYDLFLVKWAHGINSKKDFLKTLKIDVDCIETDITYCKEDGLIYNSHPPLYKSDLLFREFWSLCQSTDKIIKLDFKSIEAVEPCLKLIDKKDFQRLILNADILISCHCKREALSGCEFVEMCYKYAPGACISIGWTTVKENEIGYTWKDVYKMNDILKPMLCRDPSQFITIPVDVHMLKLNSIPKFDWLLEQYQKFNISLTLWCYSGVMIDTDCLVAIRKLLKKTSLFADLPLLSESQIDRIISSKPESNSFSLKLNPIVTGDHCYKSKGSFVIGCDTCVKIPMNIYKKLEFFVVFNDVKLDKNYDTSLQLQVQTDCPEQVKIFLNPHGVFSSELESNIIGTSGNSQNDLMECVYYVCFEVETKVNLTIAKVENYNTFNVCCDTKSGLSLEIESGITIVVNGASGENELICIDFLNDSLPLKIENKL